MDGIKCTPCPPNTYLDNSTLNINSKPVCLPCGPGKTSQRGRWKCELVTDVPSIV
eukprot:gnl/Chilomastix_caulleri/1451.p2 GENE.gnl/Chilomastix_caulleri/1451~~gnl/Chilomastix_caulleri/1451.p2  ORF type:complete len:55 (+),score=7.72 gnl/Chilomastix_caulleri/1451:174-338(+)